MLTAKQEISEILDRQPDDSSYEEMVRELAFSVMIRRGLKDSDEGRTISNEQMAHRIRSWRK